MIKCKCLNWEERELAIWNNFWGYIQISYHRLFWVFLFGCIVYWLVHRTSSKGAKKDIIFRAIFSMACSFVFVMTLFNRHVSDYAVTIKPFWSYYTAYKMNDAELWLQIIMNIAMYIPIGFSTPECFSFMQKFWKILLVTVVCSGMIEIIQYILNIGYPDVDDTLNNVIGGMIGYGIYALYKKYLEKKYTKENGK